MGHGDSVSDPTPVPPPISLISASSRLRADPTVTSDDETVMDRLSSWLAEVSAEATLRSHPSNATPPGPEPTMQEGDLLVRDERGVRLARETDD